MRELERIYSFRRNESYEGEKFNFINFSSHLFNEIIVSIFFGVLLILIGVLRQNPAIAEWWAQTFSRAYLSFISIVTRYFPFSLTEIFAFSLGVIMVITVLLIIKHLTKKKWISSLNLFLKIVMVNLGLVSSYSLTCEFAYYRPAVSLPYYTETVSNDKFLEVHNYFANDFNDCIASLSFKSDGNVVRPMNIWQISESISQTYSSLINDPYFLNTYTIAKPMATSFIFRELQITGITFNVFGEANIDVLATNLELPFTIAHELAHTKCVMREDEANQVAFYICLNSDNPYVRFSAYSLYFYQLSMLTSKAYMVKEDREQLVKLDNNYYAARNYAYKYWKDHDLLGKIGDWINNMYIKSSGIPEGTTSYQGGTGSTVIVDEENPEKATLRSSKYQALFFEKYLRVKGGFNNE